MRDVNQMREDLLREIDSTLMKSGYWVGGRLDTIQHVVELVELATSCNVSLRLENMELKAEIARLDAALRMVIAQESLLDVLQKIEGEKPVSQICRETHVQACHCCDDAGCCDNVNDRKVIVFIVDGEDVPVFVEAQDRLCDVRNKALANSHHTGRPYDDWETRDERGVLLPPNDKVEAFNFPNRVRLFLTLKVGVGGE